MHTATHIAKLTHYNTKYRHASNPLQYRYSEPIVTRLLFAGLFTIGTVSQ